MEMNKPFLVVLFIQSIYAGYFLLSKVAFDVGLNPYVFVFYRQAAATVFLAPTALFFQWKTAPPLSFTIFIKIFLLSLCGITMSLDIFGVALTYTTASLAAATINTLPVITFFLAILFRMEKVKLRTSPGFMKVSGVALCLAGATTIALYRGPFLKLLLHHHLIKSHHQQLEGHSIPSTLTWIKGVSLMLLSNLSWALWLVLQGHVLKSYPSKFLLTTLQCFSSTIQSFFVAVAFVRDPNEWKLGWDVKLISIAYCGIVVTGITFYLQTWVVEKKGPVYLAMTTPLILIFTTAASTFLFGEIISLGSVLGTLFLVGGLYCVLWGKTKEEEREKGICAAIIDAEKANGGIKEEITT
ncbi:WAT1-related protein At5g64700-like isoform X1 [Olea europaea var. sylvestris]|uniref:WAT1-related protein n=1 Tax=Olea europaea subsp. europaea TaxID=158383 RepID=A0A8S0QT04_OLEEU|nr:WAT1-related protein At5g64700-like isoform X1 [Olea europaea var. sylvestris]CAA2968795.1 WAT1-related At5g64700 [Olea europaea subsp. europaea]